MAAAWRLIHPRLALPAKQGGKAKDLSILHEATVVLAAHEVESSPAMGATVLFCRLQKCYKVDTCLLSFNLGPTLVGI